VETLIETIREYHHSPQLAPALVVFLIGVASGVIFVILPLIWGGYFSALERGIFGKGGRFFGWLLGLLYMLMGCIFLGIMFIPLAYFILWETGGVFWQIGGGLVMLVVVLTANYLHHKFRRRKYAGGSKEEAER